MKTVIEILIIAFLVTLLILLAVWYILCAKACARFNGVKRFKDITFFMFNNQYRKLSIIRHRYWQEVGVEPKDAVFDAWRENLDVEEICRFSYQLRYILTNCFDKK